VPGGGDGDIGELLAAFIRGQILQRNYRAQNEVPGRLPGPFFTHVSTPRPAQPPAMHRGRVWE